MIEDSEEIRLKNSIASSNEKSKLEATALNNIAIGLFLGGIIAPSIAWFYELTSKPNVPINAVISSMAMWLLSSWIIHSIGKSRLNGIR